LCGAGIVAVSAESYVGFEQDFGMAINYGAPAKPVWLKSRITVVIRWFSNYEQH